jgi:hypothetical protein
MKTNNKDILYIIFSYNNSFIVFQNSMSVASQTSLWTSHFQTSMYIVHSIIQGNGQEVGAQIIEKHRCSETYVYTSLSREQKMKL